MQSAGEFWQTHTNARLMNAGQEQDGPDLLTQQLGIVNVQTVAEVS